MDRPLLKGRLALVPTYTQNCQVHPLIFGALAASQKENQQIRGMLAWHTIFALMIIR